LVTPVGTIDNKKCDQKAALSRKMNDANNSFDHSYYFVDWRSAGVAVQHWLGLLPRWRIAPPDYLNFAALAGLGMSDVTPVCVRCTSAAATGIRDERMSHRA
jgi:hypothetical protein